MGAAVVLEILNQIGNQMSELLLRKFFDEIKGFNYVVQRNWENLPFSYEVNGHGDLDLFSTDDDKRRIEYVLQNYPEILCDVRSPEDNYYPEKIANLLLATREEDDGFFIPAPMAAFLALYYHNSVHKQGNPYGPKLNEMFNEMFPPVRCKDEGVGYFV